jgi:hypothetical protein
MNAGGPKYNCTVDVRIACFEVRGGGCNRKTITSSQWPEIDYLSRFLGVLDFISARFNGEVTKAGTLLTTESGTNL